MYIYYRWDNNSFSDLANPLETAVLLDIGTFSVYKDGTVLAIRYSDRVYGLRAGGSVITDDFNYEFRLDTDFNLTIGVIAR